MNRRMWRCGYCSGEYVTESAAEDCAEQDQYEDVDLRNGRMLRMHRDDD